MEISNLNMHQSVLKKCPECSNEFNCSPVDCWCSKLPLAIPVDMSKECLCPECLEKAINLKVAEKQAN